MIIIFRKLLYAILILIFLIPTKGGVKAQQNIKKISTWDNSLHFNLLSIGGSVGNNSAAVINLINFDYYYFKFGLLNQFTIGNNNLMALNAGLRYPIGKWKESESDIYINCYFVNNSPDSLGVRDFVEVPELLEVGYSHSMPLVSVKTGYRFQSGDWLKMENDEVVDIGRLGGIFFSFSFGLQTWVNTTEGKPRPISSNLSYLKEDMRMKKNYWFLGTLLSSAAGIYYQVSSNNHYDEYVSATDDAIRLHNIAIREEMYALSGFTIAATSLMHYLYYKYEEKARY